MSNILAPKIFKTKANTYRLSKKSNIDISKPAASFNYMFKPRHFPPYTTEWVNSVYCYNNNLIRLLPSLDVNAYNLIKSYFNIYLIKHNNKTKVKKSRIRTKRYTTKRLIASKPTMKHTNDKVCITIYTYDRSSTHYLEKMDETFSLDQLMKFFSLYVNLKGKYLSLENTLKYKIKNGQFKGYFRNNIINKHIQSFYKVAEDYNLLTHKNPDFIDADVTQSAENNDNPLLLYNLKKELKLVFDNNLNNYIKKVMWDEVLSIFYKQCICFEQSKYEKQHIQLLTGLLENIYNKKVVLDIVNLRYFYNSSSIFSSTILAKLKMKKNRVVNLLGLTLDKFDIPPMNKVKLYEEMYNRKRFKQNAFLRYVIPNNNPRSEEVNASYDDIETTLCNNSNMYSLIDPLNENKKLKTPNVDLYKIMGSLKNKFTKGIRIEVAGRLSKRNTAERSIYKVKYKGNIKNIDSSVKKLPSVLLRGHARSNLVYSQTKSRLRVGAFGVKTWVSSD